MKPRSYMLLLTAFLSGCATKQTDISGIQQQKAIEEIQTAEKNFQKMAAEKGNMHAFWFYADSNAVIKRENEEL